MKIALLFFFIGCSTFLAAIPADSEQKGNLIVISLLAWMLALMAYTFRK